ncbi:HNH endonuclease [Streptomyces sp. TRM 70361]|uniref:HNH endonuclease signature motif containing protein n=1 Tax=Streptomyces sp. TRM 70361 TaxID=3116553 RepID=UPI002E7B195A|nr:HNH endonuclease [Streptomyces sp. TRM 70361]MEE1937900.1 HNH endonuclease [Streptomyces sp. TRM 70361]
MATTGYTREQLTDAVARSSTWVELMRTLGLKASGGRRRALQRLVAEYAIDTGHFKRQSSGQKYTDAVLAEAVASSTTLREVVTKLGVAPATGTLSHIRRRIAAAGIDTSHLPALNRSRVELPLTPGEVREAAGSATSIRSLARSLGVPDDGRSRAALRRMLAELDVDVSHFSHARVTIAEAPLRAAVSNSTSYADVMRSLGLPVNDASHRRVHRQVLRLELDTSHFKRRTRREIRPRRPNRVAGEVLRVHPADAPRMNHARLRRALEESGVPYRCAGCGNPGKWRETVMTLHIDHVNGDWHDNRLENLRYLCPNCHAVTDTWCRGQRGLAAR